MPVQLADFVDVMQPFQVIGSTDSVIAHVSIDSRSQVQDGQTLFFALKGPRHDGHRFLEEVYQKGGRYFVVSEIPEPIHESATYIQVNNTLRALQVFTQKYREQFQFPIVGITGSNGKTIIKEWLNFLLSPDYHIIKSPKSYNSQVGVPLSVLGINEQHNFGIFEAGISTVNEMHFLQKMIQPTIGILTNIGSAHDEGFSSIAEKIKEKLKLFHDVEILIYRRNKTIESFIPKHIKTFTWSSGDFAADVTAHPQIKNGKNTLNLCYKEVCYALEIPFSDDASVENLTHCVVAMMYLGYDVDEIQRRVRNLYPIEMRLQVKKGIRNCIVIDDSYSADFQSLKIALDVLENQTQHQKKTVILSDIVQSGLDEEELYSRISRLLITHKVNRVIVIGPTISKYQKKFINCSPFLSTDDFIQDLDRLGFDRETVLIKGARVFGFERIVKRLEEKTHDTVLEINLEALSHNLNFYKSKIPKNCRLMVMIKAFGYGNGGVEIAKLLEYHRVHYLGVAFTDEGVQLKQNGVKTPIMVLNPEQSSFDALIQYGLEPEIYSFRVLESFKKRIKEFGLNHYPIHIKIDTGMHRLGFMPDEIPQLISLLKHDVTVRVESVLSHMATSDDANDSTFAEQQIELFKSTAFQFKDALSADIILHLLNTSGISNYSEATFNMVRLGIGLYGISNHPKEQNSLQQVATLKSVVSQIRTIPKGDSVGYGRSFIAERETKVATIPVGYADGIKRAWGNSKGWVSINGFRAPIIGRVCMDMLMVDVTSISCFEGDEVILLGTDPTINDMAKALDTIPYEIISTLSHRLKRVFYRE
jgi:alanine racemase